MEFKVDLQSSKDILYLVLIESDWNLKILKFSSGGLKYNRINRIRLEFKGELEGIKMALKRSINRIRLEFKEYYLLIMENDLEVLIESDWNLKYDYAGDLPGLFTVLIESDWNLKITE